MGNGDTARWGDAFQAGRDIHSIAVDVVALDDDVAEVHPDPKLQPPIFRHIYFALKHATLDLDRASDRAHHARKLHEDPVAGQLDRAPLMLRDRAIDWINPNTF